MKISLIFCSAVSCIVGFGNALTCPPRDVDEAQRLDPGRECKKSCVTDSDCSGAKKSCNCDGLCGLSCFNKDALCPELTGTLGNGTVKILLGRKYRGRAVYKCNVGYFLDGEPIRMCRSDRKWSGFAPTCTRGCDPPGRIGEGFQGSTDPGFVVGAVVQYQCKPGFYLESGNFNVTCRQDYTWSPATFICAKRECKKPLVVDNADIIGTDFHFGGSITYECKPGYLLLGSDLYRCFVSGNQVSWYPSQESKENFRTSCDPISCPAPSELENGVVNEDLAPGRVFKERISYSCNRGYRLIGQKTSRCNENGTWGTVPKCEVDPDCDFEKSANPICGYTVITGDWKRTFDLSTSNGLPGYYAKGKGELRSPSVPIQNETYCLKFKYKWKIPGDDFVISKTTLGKSNEKLIWKSKNDDDVWTSSEAILTNHDPSNGNVYWEFEVKSTVLIDDVQLVKDPNCKPDVVTSLHPKNVLVTIPTEPRVTVAETLSPTDTETTDNTTPDVTEEKGSNKTVIIILSVLGCLFLVAFVYYLMRYVCNAYVRQKERKKIIIKLKHTPNECTELVESKCCPQKELVVVVNADNAIVVEITDTHDSCTDKPECFPHNEEEEEDDPQNRTVDSGHENETNEEAGECGNSPSVKVVPTGDGSNAIVVEITDTHDSCTDKPECFPHNEEEEEDNDGCEQIVTADALTRNETNQEVVTSLFKDGCEANYQTTVS